MKTKKEKPPKKRLDIRTISKKSYQDMTLKEKAYLERKYIIRCDNIFSKYIRARDKKCVICGSCEDIQCSHLYTKNAHKSVRWDERNAYAMCSSCHARHHNIEQYSYAEWVHGKLGDEYDALKLKAYQSAFLSIDDLRDIEVYYTNKLYEVSE